MGWPVHYRLGWKLDNRPIVGSAWRQQECHSRKSRGAGFSGTEQALIVSDSVCGSSTSSHASSV